MGMDEGIRVSLEKSEIEAAVGMCVICVMMDSRHYCSRLLEVRGDSLVFENSRGKVFINKLEDIAALRLPAFQPEDRKHIEEQKRLRFAITTEGAALHDSKP